MLSRVSEEMLLSSLERAVAAAPEDLALRMHYATLLGEAGRRDAAVRHAIVLQQDPANAAALALIASGSPGHEPAPAAAEAQVLPSDTPAPEPASPEDILRQLDSELGDIAPPMFVDGSAEAASAPFEIERTGLRLSDVGGMREVKQRLEAGVLAPSRSDHRGPRHCVAELTPNLLDRYRGMRYYTGIGTNGKVAEPMNALQHFTIPTGRRTELAFSALPDAPTLPYTQGPQRVRQARKVLSGALRTLADNVAPTL